MLCMPMAERNWDVWQEHEERAHYKEKNSKNEASSYYTKAMRLSANIKTIP